MTVYVLQLRAASEPAPVDAREFAERLVNAIAADPEQPRLGAAVHLFDDRPGFFVLDLHIEAGSEPSDAVVDELIGRARRIATPVAGQDVVVLPGLFGEDLAELTDRASRTYDSAHGWLESPPPAAAPATGLFDQLAGIPGMTVLGGQVADNPGVCDWCSGTAAFRYRTAEPVALQASRSAPATTFGDWYACGSCRPLVDVADWDALAPRAGLPVPVPATALNTWRAFAELRTGEAEPLGGDG